MRLIDADALKDKLLNAIECGHRVDMPTSELEAVLNDVKTAPSIDIVRCGECKYDGTWKCPWRNTQVPRYPSADDFCSYGERKDDE